MRADSDSLQRCGRGAAVTRNSLHSRLSRGNSVPASPRAFLTSKCQDIEWIGPDHRAPERPLIKTSRGGNHSYVIYEANMSILALRKLLHAPVEINVLTHMERFIVTM